MTKDISIQNDILYKFKRDEMTLRQKAEFLFKNVLSDEYEQLIIKEDIVQKLFSTLLVKYNILWVPIK